MLRFALVFPLAVTFAEAAPIPKELRANDQSRIAGRWKLVSAKFGEAEYQNAVGTVWTLAADGSAIRDRPNEGIGKAKFAMDPSLDVKSFDWNTDEGNVFLGIYELDAEHFKVLLAAKGADSKRPTKLEPASGAYLFEFQRVK